MILEKETFEAFGYSPSALTYGSRKQIIVACDECGKVRTVFRYSYRSLCRSCVKKGDRHPNWKPKIKCICLQCGKEFSVLPWEKKRGGRKYCSHACYAESLKGKSGEETSRWAGGPIMRICKQCSKIFYVDKNQVLNGGGIFCCHPCYANFLIGKKKPKYTVKERKQRRRLTKAKTKAKRKQGLGYTILYPIKDGEEGHHITNEYVIGVPKDIHQRIGGSREKHRALMLKWLKENDSKKYQVCINALETIWSWT